MPTISFPDNKKLMRALKVISGEKGRSIASLVEEAVSKTFHADIERVTSNSFFAVVVPEVRHSEQNEDSKPSRKA
jgi:hypothetical protein